MPNQLKRDPSRTTTLRRRFIADMRRHFRKFEKANTKLIVDDDVFGLVPGIPFVANVERQEWRFQTDPQKMRSYRRWLKQQIDADILTPVGGISDKPWTAPYIESAYKKGMIRAYTDVNAEVLAESVDFFQGGKSQFLRTAFSAPETLFKIELVSTRAFTELEGVSATMSQQLSRHLANGLAQGLGPTEIARNMRKSIGTLTKTRAEVIARTEVIAAHAEGQLDGFEMLGVEEVGILAEWSTAGDDRVCPLCGELEGAVMTIKEARGLIPRHPNCRCAWIPADKKRKEAGQLWGREKDQAIKDSIQKEAPTGKRVSRTPRQVFRRSVWQGKTRVSGPKRISKKKVGKKITAPEVGRPLAKGDVPTPLPTPTTKQPILSESFYNETKGWEERFALHKKELADRIGIDLGSLTTKEAEREAQTKIQKVIKSFTAPKQSLTSYKKNVRYDAEKGVSDDLVRATKTKVNRALDEIQKIGNDDFIGTINNKKLTIEIKKSDIRGVFDTETRTVIGWEWANSKTWFHEIGHIFEDSVPVRSKVQLWLKNRSKDTVVSIKKVISGTDDIGLAYKDRFVDPYVGKLYDGGFSEALSMGFQQFSSKITLLKFAQKDFDHFAFIHGIMTGAI